VRKIEKGSGHPAASCTPYESRTFRPDMNPRPCMHCGASTIHPPATLDLLAPVCCEQCGANHGSWRSVENRTDATRSRGQPSSDLRSSRRVRSFLQGRIVFRDRTSAWACEIHDISATGARLTFAGRWPVPDEFELVLPLKRRGNLVRVVWQGKNCCGVRFLSLSAECDAAGSTS
jgi:hypothetical protein